MHFILQREVNLGLKVVSNGLQLVGNGRAYQQCIRAQNPVTPWIVPQDGITFFLCEHLMVLTPLHHFFEIGCVIGMEQEQKSGCDECKKRLTREALPVHCNIMYVEIGR